jgi:hypothetical protein
MGAAFKGRKWGGVAEIIHILHTWTSGGKGTVESSFNFLQAIVAHESLSIGRKRGEFEEATKVMMKAQRGNENALRKLWTIHQYAQAMSDAAAKYNRTPKQRRAFGGKMVVPEELFLDAAGRPPTKRELPASERWRFLPVKRFATVRKSAIQMELPHWGVQTYQVGGELQGYLQHGYKVLVALHPGKPELGAHVFNADMTAKNRSGLAFGEFLGIAPRQGDSPQVDLRKERDKASGKKKATAAMRSEFLEIENVRKITGDGPGLRMTTAVNGDGVAMRTRNAPEPEMEEPKDSTETEQKTSPVRADGVRRDSATASYLAHETKREPAPDLTKSDRREQLRKQLAKLESDAWNHF